jgi:hypothetical protein
MNDDLDKIVMEFLSHLLQGQVGGVMVYGFKGPSGPVLRMKTNLPDGPTQVVLSKVLGADPACVEAASRVLVRAQEKEWEALEPEEQERAKTLAHEMLEAACGRFMKKFTVSEPLLS